MSKGERSTGSSQTLSSLRRIGEDPLLRPFLSSLFDPQAYVRNIIKDGKSEECFAAITDCTEKINEEIQRYISEHKVCFTQVILALKSSITIFVSSFA